MALAQVAPRLGLVDVNVEAHREILGRARAGGAQLVVFPELGLTGYQLQDLSAEVAMRADDPRLTALAAETDDLSAIVSFCNRVGVDESITFWGGSEVVGPRGDTVFQAPFHDEGLYFVDLPMGDLRRERITLPLLRDERPELVRRQLERVLAERARDAGGGQ